MISKRCAGSPEAKLNVEILCLSRYNGILFAFTKFTDSPESMKELWQVTKESFGEDGYFRTGDTVTVVDGYVKILGSAYQTISSL